jgi:hypothetical protein
MRKITVLALEEGPLPPVGEVRNFRVKANDDGSSPTPTCTFRGFAWYDHISGNVHIVPFNQTRHLQPGDKLECELIIEIDPIDSDCE